MATLYHYHDPMCSWCWGYRPCAEQLFANLPDTLQRVNVLGGLAPDSDEAMPVALQETIQGYWRRIEAMLGTRFNYDFWLQCQPRRSTYQACRAVIAAGRQGHEEGMILALQKAYYLEARNPSETATLLSLAEQEGLDAVLFRQDLTASSTEKELQRQIAFTRRSPVSGFPALALEQDGRLIAIPVDYQNFQTTLATIEQQLN